MLQMVQMLQMLPKDRVVAPSSMEKLPRLLDYACLSIVE